MASGSFTNGSSIELSCDGPIRSPFIAYQQGSISYQYGKIAVYNAFKELKWFNHFFCSTKIIPYIECSKLREDI